MSFVVIPEKLPLDVLCEAARLFFEIRDKAHAVAANNDGVLFALAVSPQLADRMAVCGAGDEDDEDDGTAEFDHRLSPGVLETLFAIAPRQECLVPA